jgi:hypothetical protein
VKWTPSGVFRHALCSRRALRSAAAGACLGAAVLLPTPLAEAQVTQVIQVTKDQCIDADTSAQSLRRDGKFTAARDQLQICMSADCPALVRNDCTERFNELDHAQPTMVFDVTDGAGRDLTAIEIKVDGVRLVDHLDGTALPVDPGPHAFTFVAADQPPIERTFVLREGEKGRHEAVAFATTPPSPASAGAAAPSPEAAPGGPLPPSPPLSPSMPAVGSGVPPGAISAAPPSPQAVEALPPPAPPPSAVRIAGFVVGGLGLGGLVAGGVAAGLAAASWNEATSACSPTNCPPSTRSSAETNKDSATSLGNIATVAFIGGGALAAAGLVMILVAPRGAESPSVSVEVSPAMVGTGANVRFAKAF